MLQELLYKRFPGEIRLDLSSPQSIIIATCIIIILSVFFSLFRWVIWLLISVVLAIIQAGFGSYQIFRITIDLIVLSVIKSIIFLIKLVRNLIPATSIEKMRRHLWKVQTYREWSALASEIDRLDGTFEWKDNSDGFPSSDRLADTISLLRNLRKTRDFRALIFHLPAYVKRNHLGTDDMSLFSPCYTGTKRVIEDYIEEVNACCSYICEVEDSVLHPDEKLQFLGNLHKNLGQTALCLSGGGSLSMYHMGVLRALIESGNYQNIQVVSGTSGGSICAAMCACKTEAELKEEVLVDVISTDYRRNGVMAAEKIVWFPSLWTQAVNFVSTGFLIDNREYCRTCQYYYGEITFAEAYELTKRHVCISVTASSAAGGRRGPSKLLLNHISTPHVLLWSAVASSCALPGIMAPNRLMCKTASGDVVPFEVDGEHWVDGSFEADVPFKRMSTLFSVSNFIVSQVNFHVIPFLQHKLPEAGGSASSQSPHGMAGHSALKAIMSTLDLDLKHRVLTLAGMGLLPKMYGQDISKMFRQSYCGDVTIIPDLKVDESLGIKAIMNPTVQDMRVYLRDGRRACWPHLTRIRHLLSIEACLWGLMKSIQPHKQTIPQSINRHLATSSSDTSLSSSPVQSNRGSSRELRLRQSNLKQSAQKQNTLYNLHLNQRDDLTESTVADSLTIPDVQQKISDIEVELSMYKKILQQKLSSNHRTRSGILY